MKRSQAQANHGKDKVEREARLEAMRQWTKATRRGLQVELPLVLPAPEAGALVRQQRVAVVGPNGAGKTTLLQTMLADRGVGSIAQGGSDWMLDESVLDFLDEQTLAAHQFPLALGRRPLRSLSPGERVRAALICLFQRVPAVEFLVLDEPTYSLDLPGKRALTEALRVWPRALVVASHDLEFLREIGVEQWIELGSGHPTECRWTP